MAGSGATAVRDRLWKAVPSRAEPFQQPCLDPDDPCLLGPGPEYPLERGIDLPAGAD
jgi:hypothetical protein